MPIQFEPLSPPLPPLGLFGFQLATSSWRSAQDYPPRECSKECGCQLVQKIWVRSMIFISNYLPSFKLCALHNHWSEANMHIVVYDGVSDVGRVLDIDIVTDCGGVRKYVVRDPERCLHCWVVPYFCVGSYPNRTIKTINHRSESDIAIFSNENVPVDSGIRCDVGWLWHS